MERELRQSSWVCRVVGGMVGGRFRNSGARRLTARRSHRALEALERRELLTGGPDGLFRFSTTAMPLAPVGDGAGRLMTADLDGDGLDDLITTHFDLTGPRDGDFNSVAVLRNLGNGSYGEETLYGLGEFSHGLFTVDVDRDGDLDLFATKEPYGFFNRRTEFAILRNRGDGSFSPLATQQIGNINEGFSFTLGDVDADGDPDLIGTLADWGYVAIAKNHGDGTFVQEAMYLGGYLAGAPTVVDIDGDDDLDIVAGIWVGDVQSRLAIWRNAGNGNFGPADWQTNYVSFEAIVAEDVNGDSLPELIFTNPGDGTVSVLMNEGAGVFAAATEYLIGGRIRGIDVVDLDGDGARDLIVTGEVISFALLQNLGDGTFAPPIDYIRWGGPLGDVTAFDFDGDADLELVSIVRSPTSAVAELATPTNPFQCDIDGDQRIGISDIIVIRNNLGTYFDVTHESGDLNGDQAVNEDDLWLAVQSFGWSCETPPLPVPSTASALLARAEAIVQTADADVRARRRGESTNDLTVRARTTASTRHETRASTLSPLAVDAVVRRDANQRDTSQRERTRRRAIASVPPPSEATDTGRSSL